MGRLFKKHGILIVSAFFTLVVIMVSLVSLISVNKYKKEVTLRDTQIQNLDATLTDIGEVQTGYVVKKAVRAGEKITSENIAEVVEPVSVPVKLGLNVVTTQEGIMDKFFRASLTEGTIITNDDLVASKIDNTARYFDLVIDEMPIGIVVGDYIDIRITFPYSQDFIAIAHKKIEQINSGIAKVVLNENEIYAYQSMLMDKAVYAGTKIYAVKYFDAGAQQVAEVYYPLNTNLAELSAMNPNLLELVKQEMIAKRAQLDGLMSGGLDENDAIQAEKLQTQIELIRDGINRNITQSQADLNRRIEQQQIADAQQANQ